MNARTISNRQRIPFYCLTIALVLLLSGTSHVFATSPVLPGSSSLEVPGYGINSTDEGIPPSNSIIDLEIFDRYLWVASGNGLGRLEPLMATNNPAAGSWQYFGTDEGFGDGGVSGLTIGITSWGDTIIWAATAIDTMISGTRYAAGGGVGFSPDHGENWFWMSQPVDSVDVDSLSPTTTNVQNITYDIGMLGDRVWIASFAGGLRYMDMSSDMQEFVWVNRPPDNNPFGAVDYLNHRAFSIAVDGNRLWVGTAGGVNLSYDNGMTWQNYHHSENEASLTGDFVPALGVQRTSTNKNILWAATWAAEGSGEFYGITKSEDFGFTWRRVLGSREEPIRANNFAFDDTIVYIATDDGLYKSNDYGETWGLFPTIYDNDSLQVAYDSRMYSAAIGFDRLWAGGPEGLAASFNDGYDWRLMRTFPLPESDGEPETYAYPNPFSPSRFSVVRFEYRLDRDAVVTLEIYDFAMELVARPIHSEWRPAGYRNEVWDGSGPEGREIANGVYFYRITGGGSERWGKVLVMD